MLEWIGPDIPDASGSLHLGLFDRAIAILAAGPDRLGELRVSALGAGLTVVGFTTLSQQARTYDEYRAGLAAAATGDLRYLGIALFGHGRTIRSLTGSLRLLK